MAVSGYDPNLGRRLPALLSGAGLVDVDAEGNVFTMRGATPSMEWYVLGLERALPALVETGVVDATGRDGTRRSARSTAPLAVAAADDGVGPQAPLTA